MPFLHSTLVLMERKMSKDNLATIPDDLVPIPECAEKIGRPYSSVYNKARKGKITVHFIVGDAQARISLSEARNAFSNEKPKFSAPSFRVIRHDEEALLRHRKRLICFHNRRAHISG
jgi:hypothetical protein